MTQGVSPPGSWSPGTPPCGCTRARAAGRAISAAALAAAREGLQRLGRHLGWHGALAADAIRTDQGLRYIDINPRLVARRPMPRRAGVDLVGPLLELARGGRPRRSRAAGMAC